MGEHEPTFDMAEHHGPLVLFFLDAQPACYEIEERVRRDLSVPGVWAASPRRSRSNAWLEKAMTYGY